MMFRSQLCLLNIIAERRVRLRVCASVEPLSLIAKYKMWKRAAACVSHFCDHALCTVSLAHGSLWLPLFARIDPTWFTSHSFQCVDSDSEPWRCACGNTEKPQLVIQDTPRVLVLHVKRFEHTSSGGTKRHDAVPYDEHLSLSTAASGSPVKYDLTGNANVQHCTISTTSSS